MDDAELGAFLQEQRVVACATIDRDGLPHVMPLWYLVRDGEVWIWTYAASQKVRNLERDPRATLMVETGERYEELRGAMLRVEAVIERSIDLVTALGMALYERYLGADSIELLRVAVARVREAGYAIVNVDATLALEAPKLGAARQRMRERLADALGIALDAVNVKATTGEAIGFVGRGEGAAALAIATIDG